MILCTLTSGETAWTLVKPWQVTSYFGNRKHRFKITKEALFCKPKHISSTFSKSWSFFSKASLHLIKGNRVFFRRTLSFGGDFWHSALLVNSMRYCCKATPLGPPLKIMMWKYHRICRDVHNLSEICIWSREVYFFFEKYWKSVCEFAFENSLFDKQWSYI